jgi:sugar lactone lactonase YvrE
VKYDADQDAYFITNINGNPSQKDNNGFICRVPAERSGADSSGSVIARGGTNGVTLNAPKGTAIVADTLWVADIDAVRGFNRRTGALVASVDFSKMGAAFLNDIATGPDGALYITDTGIKFDDKGGTSPAGKQRIFKLAGRSISVAAEGDSLQGPNGITWDGPNSRFLLAPFAGKDVQSWKPGDAVPAKVWTGPGQYDGIEALADGRFLVASWADSSVHQVKGTSSARIVGGADGPADIGVDTKRNRVLVPRFMANKVEAYGIP